MRKQFTFQSGDIQMAKVNIKANSPILNLHSNLVIFKCLQKNMLLMRKFYLHSNLVIFKYRQIKEYKEAGKHLHSNLVIFKSSSDKE